MERNRQPRSPGPVFRRGMRRRNVRAAPEQLFTIGARTIVVLIDAPALQFRDDEFDKILEALRGHRIGEVETVDPGGLDPKDHLVSDLLRRADKQRAAPADRDMLGELP